MPTFCQKFIRQVPFIESATCMNSIALSSFTRQEKLRIMQFIWQDLLSHVDRFAFPQSHEDISLMSGAGIFSLA